MAAQKYKPTVGDTILLRNTGGAPYIAEVKSIHQRTRQPPQLQVLWIYRPEECPYGRQSFHGQREVMRSDHIEALLQDVAHVVGKCKIWSLEEWLSGKADQNDDAQFFSRYFLKAALQRFVPDKVPVLCSCDLPLNPDIWMLECTSCGQWYHPECIGLSEETARKLVGQFCCDCQQKLAAS